MKLELCRSALCQLAGYKPGIVHHRQDSEDQENPPPYHDALLREFVARCGHGLHSILQSKQIGGFEEDAFSGLQEIVGRHGGLVLPVHLLVNGTIAQVHHRSRNMRK